MDEIHVDKEALSPEFLLKNLPSKLHSYHCVFCAEDFDQQVIL